MRRPRRPAEKYGLRAYDEIILAPMVILMQVGLCQAYSDSMIIQCLFEPRVIDFDELKQGVRPSQDPGVSEDIVDIREPRDALMEKYVRRSRLSCG